MATYNGGRYIENQLLSILNQLGDSDEVIISDDGSSDDTLSIISGLCDKRIKLIEHPRNWLAIDTSILTRVKKNFDAALRLTSGDYIFLADQDDEWLPGRVTAAISLLEKETDLTVSDCIVVDEQGSVIFSSYYDLIPPSDAFIRTIIKSSFHGCCMAFRSRMLKHILPFPDKDIGHDTWIGLVCLTKGNVGFLKEPYVKYIRHMNTVTQCGFKSNRPLMVKIKYRFDLLFSILGRVIKNG